MFLSPLHEQVSVQPSDSCQRRHTDGRRVRAGAPCLPPFYQAQSYLVAWWISFPCSRDFLSFVDTNILRKKQYMCMASNHEILISHDDMQRGEVLLMLNQLIKNDCPISSVL